jgi:hypothetical protein
MRTRLNELRGDRGAATVLVAITLVVLFGAAALSIDAGSLWHTRRDVITDTDAAALAAAGHLLEDGSQCDTAGAEAESDQYLGLNDAATVPDTFSVSYYNGDCTLGAGTVEVAAHKEAQLTFAPVLGVTTAPVKARSVAQYGALNTISGLRPIGICVANSHIQEWIAAGGDPADPTYAALRGNPAEDHPIYSAAGVVHRIYFEKEQEAACGDSDGNWGWLDFNGNDPPNGSAALNDRLRYGYEGPVSLGGPASGDEDCQPVSGSDDCPGSPGANASTKDALDFIKCPATTPTSDCLQFPVIVYDQVTGGGGSKARYHPVAFLGVVLRGYAKITGSPEPDSYFDFELVRLQWQGNVGPNPQGSTGVPAIAGVQLCGGGYGATQDNNCNV